jgi:hypothetical protein
MIKRTLWIGLTLSLLGMVSAVAVRADEWDKRTVLTFSQPVEVPGQVLPAGRYMFKLADSIGDRHILQIFSADGSQIIATVMTIPDYRLISTDQTVIKFYEMPRGAREAIRAWFYPGNTIGQTFVYPKPRATQLAKAAKAVVPALAIDVADVAALKIAPIVAITPEAEEVPVAAALQTSPVERIASVTTVPNGSSPLAGTTGVEQTGQSARRNARQLPNTASALPLIAWLGFGFIAVALGLMAAGKRATAKAVTR